MTALGHTGTDLTATGYNQAIAFPIHAGQFFSAFTNVQAGTGCMLPWGISTAEEYVIANQTGNALLVYPPPGGTIGGAAVDAAYSLPAGKTGYFCGANPPGVVSPPAFSANP